MLKIRQDQLDALDKSALEPLVLHIMNHLRTRYPDRVPASDSDLRESVIGWITDARRWGFTRDRELTEYADFRARTTGYREPLELRLKTYLKLYHENLLSKVDLDRFVQTTMQLASRHSIQEEEGIAWLAVILLAGRQKGDLDQDWIGQVLDQTHLGEEARLRQVHQQAVERGWIQPPRVP